MPDPLIPIAPTPLGLFIGLSGLIGGEDLPPGTRIDVGGRAGRRGLPITPVGPGQLVRFGGDSTPTPQPLPVGVAPPNVPAGVVPPGLTLPPDIVLPSNSTGSLFPGFGESSLGGFGFGAASQVLTDRGRVLAAARKRRLEEEALRRAGRSTRAAPKIPGPAEKAAVERAILRSASPKSILLSGAMRIFGSVAGLLYPSEVNPGVPTPEEIARMTRGQDINRELLGNMRDLILRPIELTQRRLPKPAPTLRKPNVKLETIDPAPVRSDPSPRASTSAPRASKPAAARRPTARAPTATRSPTPSARPGSPRSSIIPSVVRWSDIIQSLIRRRSSAPRGSTSTSSIVNNFANPLTVVQSLPLPSPAGPPAGSSTQQRQCEDRCKKKKKKKARKCLERGQVEWRTGRFKGKIAGTKCARFAKE